MSSQGYPSNRTLSGDESLVLPEFDAPADDPVALLGDWLERAERVGVSEPRACTLATSAGAGHPSSRVLLLKELSGGGLVFTTSRGSRKGLDLAVAPWGSATFHWRETMQQVNVAGPTALLSDAESDALFAERPVAAQATTAVSEQSALLADEDALAVRARELVERGEALPRPPAWGGYRLTPERIEFWQGRASRLHRRLEYTRVEGVWTHRRLQP